ncbi:EF-hand domain-containing protein [Roseobacter weihaiensis]|uniref:EF-hand domain-containing protein n=1 Tax=Roseobacter weihaiensis TaxID=2763262 RepID=UPI001D09C10F|nr:EF-hand domain-containing protein [Roseobacter sp. H9]
MKRLTFTAGVTLCAIALASGAALARSGDRPAPASFEQLDTNGDGQITREEMSVLRGARLARADTDSDGLISLSELEIHSVERSRERAQAMMDRLDADADGMLSSEELGGGERANRMFERVDQDGDGAINQAEFDAARDRMPKRGPQVD